MYKMKKKCLIYAVIGSLGGISLSFIIPLFISLTINDGMYYPVTLEMITSMGGQLNAVVVQTLLSIVYGATLGMASLIFELDRWSLTKQTISHLVVTSLVTFPVAYLCYWMDHNFKSIFIYFGIFFAIYLFIWITQYISIYHQIKKMNKKVESN